MDPLRLSDCSAATSTGMAATARLGVGAIARGVGTVAAAAAVAAVAPPVPSSRLQLRVLYTHVRDGVLAQQRGIERERDVHGSAQSVGSTLSSPSPHLARLRTAGAKTCFYNPVSYQQYCVNTATWCWSPDCSSSG